MKCPSDDLVRSLLDQPDIRVDHVDAISHLANCSDCRSRIESWGEISKWESAIAGNSNSALRSHEKFEEVTSTDGTGEVSKVETVTYLATTPRKIGNFELGKRIGRGGGGEVFEAVHSLLQRRMAIKLLRTKDVGDEQVRRRFLREMESIGRLNHPHIVQALDAGEADGVLYLAMELVEGPNVEALANKVSPFPVPEACEIIRQAALGLQHIHDNGLVHRDLKPSNLLFGPQGVKIADLGMALLRTDEVDDDRITGSCVILGTADYMAPEQSEGARYVDIRADLYSLGCTFFRLLVGEPPFASLGVGSLMQKLYAHAHAPVPDVANLRPDVPKAVLTILSRLLAKKKEDRYDTPQEVALLLSSFSVDSNFQALCESHQIPHVSGSAGQSDSSKPRSTNPPISTVPQTEPGLLTRMQRHGRGITVGFAVAVFGMLVIAGGWQWLTNWRIEVPPKDDADRGQPPLVNVSPGPTSLTKVVPPVRPDSRMQAVVSAPTDHRVLDSTESAITKQEPKETVPSGATARRWLSEFKIPPENLPWPGQGGLGSWQIDENLRSLVIQTTRTRRFIKLGELKEIDRDWSLSVDMMPQSSDGAFGIFLGYQPDNKDLQEFALLQAIHVQLRPLSTTGEVLIRRYQAKLISITGNLQTNWNCSKLVQIPKSSDKLRLKLTCRSGSLSTIHFNEADCEELFKDSRTMPQAFYPQVGDFGLFVDSSTVWFSNPQFKRGPP